MQVLKNITSHAHFLGSYQRAVAMKTIREKTTKEKKDIESRKSGSNYRRAVKPNS